MTLASRLKSARQKARLTQADVARRFGINSQAVSGWERGEGGPSREKLAEIAKLYDVSVEWLLDGTDSPQADPSELSPPSTATVRDSVTNGHSTSETPWRNEVSHEGVPSLAGLSSLPLDLPVYGAAQGGDGLGEFELNGRVVERVRRPPALVGVKDAFAVYVFGDSMLPRFEPGEMVFIHPGKPPTQGRDVLVELFNGTDEHLAGAALIKRFVSRSSEKLVLEQFNPPKKITIPGNRVKGVFVVMRPDELFRS